MTNRIAFALALVIVALIAWDGYARDWQATLFLARKLLSLVDFIKFWR